MTKRFYEATVKSMTIKEDKQMKDKTIKGAMNDIEKIIRDVYSQGYNDGLKDGKASVQIDDSAAYKAGLKAAWELVRRVSNLGYNDRRKEMFGERYGLTIDIVKDFSVTEVADKIEEYEEKQKRTCDTCQYGGHTLQDLRKCVYCDGRYYWTPKKMTLDEAIKHCEEVADSKCDECGAEHRQLAEWLKELKELKEEERREEDDEI